jgi:SAM-dependent methyltransferase
MGYLYGTGDKFDRDKFKSSVRHSIELGKFRLAPSLNDVDSLIFFHRTPILSKWIEKLPHGLTLVDIGGRIQPYRPLLDHKVIRYIAIDLQFEGLVNVLADAQRLPLCDSSCDVIICADTLQYIPNPAMAVTEMHRVLRPTGALILATRGLYPEHHDEYWRFLPHGLRYLLRDFSTVEIVAEENSMSGLLIAINVLLHRNTKSPSLRWLARKAFIPFLNRIGLFLNRLSKKDSRCACGFSVLAKK